MFNLLKKINYKPEPFEFYSADLLWTDEHTVQKMLSYHLNDAIEASSRGSTFIDKSVDWICSYFKVSNETQIADFGCGPGLYSQRLSAKGANVTGIDFSKNSLEYAKKQALENNLSINYVYANYLDYELTDKYDLICLIFCDYCALSPAQRAILLKKFRSMLKPNGKVLLDVHSLNMFTILEEKASYEFNYLDNFWSADDYYCFINNFKYEDQKVGLDKYTIIERDTIKVVYNWLQYFNPTALEKEFIEAGFTNMKLFKNVAGEDYDESHTEFAIVAE
ncbi:class I SAM-dependent methyltransferase [Lentisphaerota bacterium WC36G]|nr:class I SAM-dependent methyltransferase [Lentisphaerae bacterium WC36]